MRNPIHTMLVVIVAALSIVACGPDVSNDTEVGIESTGGADGSDGTGSGVFNCMGSFTCWRFSILGSCANEPSSRTMIKYKFVFGFDSPEAAEAFLYNWSESCPGACYLNALRPDFVKCFQ